MNLKKNRNLISSSLVMCFIELKKYQYIWNAVEVKLCWTFFQQARGLFAHRHMSQTHEIYFNEGELDL